MRKGAIFCLMFFLFAISFVSAATVPTNGLVAHYKFNDGSGTTLSDSKGSYDGNLQNGPTWSATGGIQGGALNFDGVDDYVALPNDLGYTDAVSSFIWFKESPGGTEWNMLLGATELEIGFGTTDANTYIGLHLDDGQRHYCHPASMPSINDDGQWHHWGLTYDGSILRAYLDGNEICNKAVSGTPLSSFSCRYIGQKGCSGDLNTNPKGLIDELTVYNRALSSGEVTTLFDAKGNSESGAGDIGDFCGYDPDCESGICMWGQCTSGEVGSDCQDSGDCLNGRCDIYRFQCTTGLVGSGCGYNTACISDNCDLETHTCVEETSVNCSDDDGYNPSVRGTYSGDYIQEDGSRVFIEPTQEFCNSQEGKLVEAYCQDDGYLNYTFIDCPNECLDGICVPDPNSCVDSDDGLDYFNKGNVTFSGEIKHDSCGLIVNYFFNPDYLKEYYCEDNELKFAEYDCPSWCVDGECVDESVTCIDTDGGNFPDIVGDNAGNYTWLDGNTYKLPLSPEECGVDENGEFTIIWEGYCDANGDLQYNEHTCPDVCYEGACYQRIEPRCEDTEPENDYLFTGTVSVCDEYDNCVSNSDSCIDEDTLSETFCIGADKWIWEYDCPSGCIDGACIDDCFGPWECTVEPLVCPQTGVQTQRCVREDICMDVEEELVREVSCDPGVCSGCVVNDECVPIGTRFDDGGQFAPVPSYCSEEGILQNQKQIIEGEDTICVNDFECVTNVCGAGKCVDLKGIIDEFNVLESTWANILCRITPLLQVDDSYDSCILERFGGSV